MTRTQITAAAIDALQEYKGDPQSGSPFAWDLLINEAVNWIAAETGCLYGEAGQDIVANQAIYPCPAFIGGAASAEIAVRTCVSCYSLQANGLQTYATSGAISTTNTPVTITPLQMSQIVNSATVTIATNDTVVLDTGTNAENVVVTGTTGTTFTCVNTLTHVAGFSITGTTPKRRTIWPITQAAMDSKFPHWRDTPAATSVKNWVVLGSNQIALYPVPNYNSTFDPTGATPGGLIIEGHLLPSLMWNAPTAECPLPTNAHTLVWMRAAMARIAQNPTTMNQARFKFLERRWGTEGHGGEWDTFYTQCVRQDLASRRPAYVSEYDNDDGDYGYAINYD